MNSMKRADLIAALETLPDTLQDGAARWLEAFEQAGADLEFVGAADDLLRLVAVSEFAGRVLLRDPDYFFGGNGDAFALPDSATIVADTLVLADSGDNRASFMRRLRELRNRTLVQVLWHDLVLRGSVETSLAGLSHLAEACLDAAVRFAGRQLEPRFGRPLRRDEPMPLIVLAMGKLGGRELNFSSDIDIIFLYPGEGETNGSRRISAHEYFAKLSRETVALLEEATPDGFVYRVDTRLRPFGHSGPPVASFAALESYLVEHGRGWERYAYVKARPVTATADTPAARRLMSDIVSPFVYRRYLDYGVFESLRNLHTLIAAEVQKKEMAENIKLGPGGIREIEFIVQSLQLVRGGSAEALKTTGLRQAMSAAVDDCDLTAADARILIEAYDFLRRVENALQGMRDRQTHDLPADTADRARLAFALGLSGIDEFDAKMAATRAEVSRRFRAIGIRDEDGAARASERPDIENLWASRPSAEEWATALEELEIPEAGEVGRILAAFAAREAVRRIDSTAARRLRRFIASLLVMLESCSSPVTALERVLEVVDSVLRRSAYLALLNENPAVLERLVSLCEQSVYLAGEIARYPVLLDELFDARIFVDPPTSEDIEDELDRALKSVDPEDVEGSIEALAEFKRAILFRLAVADFSGSIPVMKVSDRLTEIAERILRVALEVATADLTRQFGEPEYRVEGEVRKAGLGIIAYGKLAGFELSYASDLDLVFIHDSRGDDQQTNGARPVENPVFFSRLVRRLMHFLTTRTASGTLYEIDTRLRPSGRSGLLVTSDVAFGKYQDENAWTWEHQALLRSRPVGGSERVADAFRRIRATTLRYRVRRDALRDDVLDMRRKMRAELDRTSDREFDLKQGYGGVADIEFLVQYLVLANAERDPDVIEYPDNIRQLDALAAAGHLTTDIAGRLQTIYRTYRARIHRLALDRRPALAAADVFLDEREFVTGLWDQTFGGEAR